MSRMLAGPGRLLLVVDSLDLGGAERHVAGLAAALRRRGYDVVVACSTRGALAPSLEREGLPVLSMTRRLAKRRFSPAFARGLRRLLSGGERFDLVHAHVYAAAAASAAAGLGLGVPLVVTEHTEASWQGWRARAVTRWYCRRARHVIAVSTPIRRRLIGRDGVPPEKVSVIPAALPEVEPPGADPTEAVPGRNGRLAGVVARLQPEKGVATFLEAVARIAPRVPGVRFLVVGDGPLREELVGMAGRLGLRGRVRFLGFRPDAREIIRHLDVLVVPSLTEGSPLVVLEAMASGVPVVASAVGGIPDQIRHGREGLLVPTGDPAALGEAMLSLLSDPGYARRMGAAGRRRAVSDFGHDRMVSRIESVYRAVLAGRSGATLAPGGPGEERPPVGGLRSPSS